MPAPSTAVKHFRHTMTGAPVLNGTAGSLIAVLDACLVNGFNVKTLDSLTVSNGVATATVSAGHGFADDVVVLISGATPSGLNGEKRLLSRTTTTFTFNAEGIPDGNATGTITAKVAPAGWEKVFSATNVAVYRSADPAGTRMFLRVDDTNQNNARVVGYESMTDVNTGTGPFPTSSQMPGGLYWPKASDGSTTARGWEIIADSRVFYLHTCTSSSANIEGGVTTMFGDFISFRSADAYAAALLGVASAQHANNSSNIAETIGYSRLANTVDGLYCPRNYTGLGSAAGQIRRMLAGQSADFHSGSAGFAYPNGPDNGLLLFPLMLITQVGGNHLLGKLPGVYGLYQNCHGSFSAGAHLDGHGDLYQRKLAVVKGGYPAGTSSTHMVVIDITGPWF